MAKITEVRVHGVSGTPPAAMLRTEPRRIESRPRPLSEDDLMADDVDVAVRDATAEYKQTLEVSTAAKLSRGKREKRRPVEVSLHPRYESPPEDGLAEPTRITAYNWSKLTSGRARHALWLLLLPYTFMNVAGWMLPARQRAGDDQRAAEIDQGPSRFLEMLVRVGGGVVTGIFALFAAAITLDLWASKCRPGTETCSFGTSVGALNPAWWIFFGSLAALIVTVVVGFWIGYDRRRGNQADDATERLERLGGEIAAPEPGEDDPVATLRLTDSTMWHRRSLTRHLIWVHIGAAGVVLAWVLVVIRMNSGTVAAVDASVTPWSIWVALVGAVIVGYGLVAASFGKHGNNLRYSRTAAVAAIAGIATYVLAMVEATALADLPWIQIGIEEALASVSVGSIAILTVIGVVIVLVGLVSERANTSGPAAMVVLAGLVGASYGAGAYTLVQRMLISGREAELVMRDGLKVAVEDAVPPLGGIDWAAVGFLVFILATILIALAIFAVEKATLPDKIVTEGLRHVTTRVRALLGLSALVALLGGLLFFVIQRSSDIVESPFDVASELTNGVLLVLAVGVVVAAGVGILRYKGWKWGLGVALALGAAVAAFAFGLLSEIKILGVVIRLDSARELTVSLALLVPATFIVSRMISMLRNSEQRRGIGILWDLASFWQRWFHPFAAPTYGPVAIPDLAAYIRENAADGDKVVVAAHSQGTVIAMAALLTFDEERDAEILDRLAFLSYGSPIEHLYVRLFPAYFDDDAIKGLLRRLNGDSARWRNLWRQSDPIGGDIEQLGAASVRLPDDDPNVADGHSEYEKTTFYREERARLIEAL